MSCVKRRVIFIKMSSEIYNISKLVLVALFVAIAVVGNVQNMNYVQQCTMIFILKITNLNQDYPLICYMESHYAE